MIPHAVYLRRVVFYRLVLAGLDPVGGCVKRALELSWEDIVPCFYREQALTREPLSNPLCRSSELTSSLSTSPSESLVTG